jgi:hypothetical protein
MDEVYAYEKGTPAFDVFLENLENGAFDEPAEESSFLTMSVPAMSGDVTRSRTSFDL